jgi:hypothetical protein
VTLDAKLIHRALSSPLGSANAARLAKSLGVEIDFARETRIDIAAKLATAIGKDRGQGSRVTEMQVTMDVAVLRRRERTAADQWSQLVEEMVG